nr:MAG TPA: hypothetical protein [Caudoviricetes sp.]
MGSRLIFFFAIESACILKTYERNTNAIPSTRNHNRSGHHVCDCS